MVWQLLSPCDAFGGCVEYLPGQFAHFTQRSCRQTAQAFLAWWNANGENAEPSPNTAACCEARQRLDTRGIHGVHHAVRAHIETGTMAKIELVPFGTVTVCP